MSLEQDKYFKPTYVVEKLPTSKVKEIFKKKKKITYKENATRLMRILKTIEAGRKRTVIQILYLAKL